MPEEVVPTPAATPAPPAAAPQAAPPPATAPQTPPAQVIVAPQEPRYLSDRLEQKARGTLKDLGFKAPKGQSIEESVKQAKEKYENQVARRKKAEGEREEIAAKALVLETQLQGLKQVAQLQMQTLSDDQKRLVMDAAGDDPVVQLQQIATLQRVQKAAPVTQQAPQAPQTAPATPPAAPQASPQAPQGVAQPPAAPAPPGGAQAAPPAPPATPPPAQVAPPANTAAPNAPPPAAPAGEEDAKATYEALRAANPYLAAQYLLNNPTAIYQDRTIDQVKQSRR